MNITVYQNLPNAYTRSPCNAGSLAKWEFVLISPAPCVFRPPKPCASAVFLLNFSTAAPFLVRPHASAVTNDVGMCPACTACVEHKNRFHYVQRAHSQWVERSSNPVSVRLSSFPARLSVSLPMFGACETVCVCVPFYHSILLSPRHSRLAFPLIILHFSDLFVCFSIETHRHFPCLRFTLPRNSQAFCWVLFSLAPISSCFCFARLPGFAPVLCAIAHIANYIIGITQQATQRTSTMFVSTYTHTHTQSSRPTQTHDVQRQH